MSSDILFGIFSDILFGIFPDIPSGILFGRIFWYSIGISSDILFVIFSEILSDLWFDILCHISSEIFFGMAFGKGVEDRQRTLGDDGRGCASAANTVCGWSWLGSGRDQLAWMVVVAVQQRILGVDGRGSGPAASTACCWLWLRCSKHWVWMVVVEVRQRTLGVYGGGWIIHTNLRSYRATLLLAPALLRSRPDIYGIGLAVVTCLCPLITAIYTIVLIFQ